MHTKLDAPCLLTHSSLINPTALPFPALQALGIDDVANFDFMDPPPRAAIIRCVFCGLLVVLGVSSVTLVCDKARSVIHKVWGLRFIDGDAQQDCCMCDTHKQTYSTGPDTRLTHSDCLML